MSTHATSTVARAALAAGLLACLPLARADSPPPPSGAKQARALFETATKRYNVGDYRDALDGFKQAYMAKPDPVFLFNMGQCYRQLGDPENAARQYRAYLRESPSAPNRSAVDKFIDDADEELKRKAANTPPTGVLPGGAVKAEPVEPAPVVAPVAEKPPEPEKESFLKTMPKKKWFWPAVGGAAAVVVAVVVIAVVFSVPNDASATGTIPGASVNFQ